MQPNRVNHSRAAQHPREPFDWYCEDRWPVEALIKLVPFEGLVYDPCAGRGNIPSVFQAHGFETHASDIVDRGYWPGLRTLDFLGGASSAFRVPNVVCNPPYSYKDGIAEAFVRRALEIATDRVAALVPIKWLGSIGRYSLFEEEFPPETVNIFSERPSMPPGSKIDALGPRAFRGGTIDYMWVVWKVGERGPKTTNWIPPRPEAERKARRRG